MKLKQELFKYMQKKIWKIIVGLLVGVEIHFQRRNYLYFINFNHFTTPSKAIKAMRIQGLARLKETERGNKRAEAKLTDVD